MTYRTGSRSNLLPIAAVAVTLLLSACGGGNSDDKEPPPGNNPPVATTNSLNATEDQPLSGTLGGSDADGDSLTFRIQDSPDKGIVSLAGASTGEFTFIPDPDAFGTDSFSYVVSDGTLESSPQIVSIIIAGVNDAPIAVDDAFSASFKAAFEFSVTANDIEPDGDDLSVTDFTTVDNGSLVDLGGGNFRYLASENFEGVDSFNYTIDDGSGEVSSANVTLSISASIPPVAVNDASSVNEDELVVINVLQNDSDPDAGDTLTVTATTAPARGKATINSDGTVTYTPDADQNGNDSFV